MEACFCHCIILEMSFYLTILPFFLWILTYLKIVRYKHTLVKKKSSFSLRIGLAIVILHLKFWEKKSELSVRKSERPLKCLIQGNRLVLLLFQAQDKGRWQRLFSHFCSRTANEEEQIVHKLLGGKFQVNAVVYRHRWMISTILIHILPVLLIDCDQGQLAVLRNLFTTALDEDRVRQVCITILSLLIQFKRTRDMYMNEHSNIGGWSDYVSLYCSTLHLFDLKYSKIIQI